MKITSVKGTNDYLPLQVQLRDYLQTVILNTYQNNGFQRIMTPAIEDIENLDKSDGGDNLNLIFKIMKRGDKLESAMNSGNVNELSDLGLRYDLTLPLSRYYANNKDKLVLPMKCIQIDKVYRAERPQKGRLREFVQCDIDIIGSNSYNSEIELITTTSKALLAIGIKNFTVKINDRKLLKSILLGVGFEESQVDSVCITFDKLDKIGVGGVKNELLEKGYGVSTIDRFVEMLNKRPFTLESMQSYCSDADTIANLTKIINAVQQLSNGNYEIQFDLSLVRGQGYYTGTIFEIQSNDFKGSIAGGGRYDHLIGKFTNSDVPAVGFSIGFERIFSILSETGYEIPSMKKKIAVLYQSEDIITATKKADELRADYDVSLFETPKKTGKFLNKLKDAGFFGFYIIDQSEEINVLD